MAKGKDSFSDGSALLDIIRGTISGEIDELFDLSRLPRKMLEIERKYRLTRDKEKVDVAIAGFLAKFGKFLADGQAKINKFITFAGVDQYFIVKKNQSEYVFRYRVGANRPPQLTVKFQMHKGSNLIRGELNIDVKNVSPEIIRAFMSVICSLGDSSQLFSIQQSGNIWILEEPDANLIEVVVYRVDRVPEAQQVEGFVEIEPLNSKTAEQVVATIDKYEKSLELTDLVCAESIADIFRPKGGDDK
ncbi:MAG: hypothetical protein PHE52_02545 [Candidatus Pacebacteria bacterium]|nr:hypothetical protein [Candidatus Paceibacterota bacterium]